MASLLYRLGRWSHRRWFVMLPAWLIILVIIGGLAASFKGTPSTTFTIPGIASEKAQNLVSERFGDSAPMADQNDPSFTVVIAAPEGQTLTEPENQAKVQSVIDGLRSVEGIASPDALGLGNIPAADFAKQRPLVDKAAKAEGDPAPADWFAAVQLESQGIITQLIGQGTPAAKAEADAQAVSSLSADGTVYRLNTGFDTSTTETAMDVTAEQRDAVISAVNASRDSGLDVEYNGQAMQNLSALGGSAELIGVAAALVVLAITFSSIVAAFIPIVTALVGVGTSVLLVTALSGVVDTNDMTPILATMLGLAVAIDYSLFIASRYRHEIRHTDNPSHAAGRAVGTAGSAVVFAGLTVFIALASLSIIGIPFLTTMALAAAGAIVISVLIALTLLPAVLGALKTKAFAVRIPKVKAPDPEDEDVTTFGERWVRGISRRPLLPLIGGILLLAVIAIPAAGVQLALPSDSVAEAGTPEREASDLVARGFGAGANGQLLIAVDAREVSDQHSAVTDEATALQQRLADAAKAQAQQSGQSQGQGQSATQPDPQAILNLAAFTIAVNDLSALDGVEHAQLAGVNEAGDTAIVIVTPTTGPVDSETTDLMHAIRDHESEFTQATGATYGVTGLTAIQADVSEQLSDALVPYLLIVVGLAFLLLMIVFRSILVPLTAALGFLLSVAATFGATVAIFQWGWGGIVTPAPLVSFLPIFLIGVVFGLAMDYQVFLVSRMREAYVHGETASESVTHGFKYGARVVTAAAIIMISVFSAFIAQDMSFIKAMGFALAAAVALDAFVVRMTIIPAVMYLLGDRMWWLPKWLQKILPKVDIEGESLAKTDPDALVGASATPPADPAAKGDTAEGDTAEGDAPARG